MEKQLIDSVPSIVKSKLIQSASIIVIISLYNTILFNDCTQPFLFNCPTRNSWLILAQIPIEIVNIKNPNKVTQFLYDNSKRIYNLLLEKGNFMDKLSMFDAFSKVHRFKADHSVSLLYLIVNELIDNDLHKESFIPVIINWFDLGVEGIFMLKDLNLILRLSSHFIEKLSSNDADDTGDFFFELSTLLKVSFDCCREDFMKQKIQEKEPFLSIIYSMMSKDHSSLLMINSSDHLDNPLLDFLNSFCDALIEEGEGDFDNDLFFYDKEFLSNVYMNLIEIPFVNSSLTSTTSLLTILPTIAKMNLILKGKIVQHLRDQKISSLNFSFIYWIIFILSELEESSPSSSERRNHLLEEILNLKINFPFILFSLLKENIIKNITTIDHATLVPFLMDNFIECLSIIKKFLTISSNFDDVFLAKLTEYSPVCPSLIEIITILSVRNASLYHHLLESNDFIEFHPCIIKQLLYDSHYQLSIPFLKCVFTNSSNIEVANDLFIYIKNNSPNTEFSMHSLPFSMFFFLNHCIRTMFSTSFSFEEKDSCYGSLLLAIEALPEISLTLLNTIIPLLHDSISSGNDGDAILLLSLPLLSKSLKNVNLFNDFSIFISILKRSTNEKGISDDLLKEIISFLECLLPFNTDDDSILISTLKILLIDDDSFTESQLLYQISPLVLMIKRDLCERGSSHLIRENFGNHHTTMISGLLSSTSNMQIYRLLKNKHQNQS